MGHVFVIFGTLIAFNYGIGYMVSDRLYEDDPTKQGEVKIEEIPEAKFATEANH